MIQLIIRVFRVLLLINRFYPLFPKEKDPHLTTADLARITGATKTEIGKLIRSGLIRAKLTKLKDHNRKYLIPMNQIKIKLMRGLILKNKGTKIDISPTFKPKEVSVNKYIRFETAKVKRQLKDKLDIMNWTNW